MSTRTVQIGLSDYEQRLLRTADLAHQMLRDGATDAALLIYKITEALNRSDVKPGDTVNWGPAPYGTRGLKLLAVHGEIGWLLGDSGYVTLPVAELWRD